MQIFITSTTEEIKYRLPIIKYDRKYDLVNFRINKNKNKNKLILEIIIKEKVRISSLKLIIISGIINVEIESTNNMVLLIDFIFDFMFSALCELSYRAINKIFYLKLVLKVNY